MAQQLVNGSHRKGDVTVTNRMTRRYAVVNPPGEGKHHRSKPIPIQNRMWFRKRMGKVGGDLNGLN